MEFAVIYFLACGIRPLYLERVGTTKSNSSWSVHKTDAILFTLEDAIAHVLVQPPSEVAPLLIEVV